MGTQLEQKVSIIIVTYNALDYVKKCMNSVLANTDTKHEIIVVDNASDTETLQFLSTFQERQNLKLIFNDENKLWSPGNNQGLRASSTDSQFCLLLNSDVEVFSEHWLSELQKPMASFPKVGITGTQFNFSPISPTYGAIDGCCFMFRRKLLDEIGYLDERYPWNGAGSIFTFNAWTNGYYFYHVDTPGLLVHYGKRSRVNNDMMLKNQKIDKIQVRKEAGLEPRYDLWAYFLHKLNLFNINKRLASYYT